MLYLDFHPMSIFSRKDFLYNKALATTLEGSRNLLGGTSARSGCDETGSAMEFDDILENIEGWNFTNGLGSNSNGLILCENDATGLWIMFQISIWPSGA